MCNFAVMFSISFTSIKVGSAQRTDCGYRPQLIVVAILHMLVVAND